MDKCAIVYVCYGCSRRYMEYEDDGDGDGEERMRNVIRVISYESAC